MLCENVPGARRRTTNRPTTSSPRMSGASNRARNPARRVISLISLRASSRKSETWIGSGWARACSTFGSLRPIRRCVSAWINFLIHAVCGTQVKFALLLVEDVDRTGLDVGVAHRLGDDSGVERSGDRASSSLLATLRRVHATRRPSDRDRRYGRATRGIGVCSQVAITAWLAKVRNS